MKCNRCSKDIEACYIEVLDKTFCSDCFYVRIQGRQFGKTLINKAMADEIVGEIFHESLSENKETVK